MRTEKTVEVRCIKVSWRLFGGLNLKCLLMYGLMTMPGEPIKQIMRDFSRLGMTLGIRLCPEFGIPQTQTCYNYGDIKE
jgi:hypothetical protein